MKSGEIKMSVSKCDMALTQPEFEQLQAEVIKRIDALEQAKAQIASQAAQLIAKIEQARIASIENIDSLIQFYRVYTAENKYDQQALQRITKLLTTRLQIVIDQDLALNFKEEPIIEEENKHHAQQIPSNQIISKYCQSPRQTCILSAAPDRRIR
jgi:hypothetical protein